MDPFFSSSPAANFQEELISTFDLPGPVTERLPLPPPSPMPKRSAFSRYSTVSSNYGSLQPARGSRNIHKRIIGLLKRIRSGKQESKNGAGRTSSIGGKGSRGFRHMMHERQRRERLSQSYAELFSMLSPRTKADKNSIVQTAAEVVRELKGVKEGMQKRNEEMMRMVGASTSIDRKRELGGEGVITVRAANSTSAIDSVIDALRCLQRMDVKAGAITSQFSGGGGSGITGGVIAIQTNKGSGAFEVQKKMEKLLAVEGWR